MPNGNTDHEDMLVILSRMVRFGIVTEVNNKDRLVRVKYPDMLDSNGQPLISEWIPVLINRDFTVDYTQDPQRTEYEEGGSGAPAYESHKHDIIIIPYMPKVNHQVLCLYEPIRNGRGVCLGGIRPHKTGEVPNPGPYNPVYSEG